MQVDGSSIHPRTNTHTNMRGGQSSAQMTHRCEVHIKRHLSARSHIYPCANTHGHHTNTNVQIYMNIQHVHTYSGYRLAGSWQLCWIIMSAGEMAGVWLGLWFGLSGFYSLNPFMAAHMHSFDMRTNTHRHTQPPNTPPPPFACCQGHIWAHISENP